MHTMPPVRNSVTDATIVSSIVSGFLLFGCSSPSPCWIGLFSACLQLSITLSGQPHCHWRLHASVIHLARIRLGPYRLIGIWLISKWLISSRWEGKVASNEHPWTMVVHWNSKSVPLHQIWSLSLNNIMFFLRSTSFVILKFTKHFDAIDEEHIELVMS